jgi:hypothetical protein
MDARTTSQSQLVVTADTTQRTENVAIKGRLLLTDVGLSVPDDLTFEQWEEAASKISGIASSAAWCLGDWLIYGQQRYSDRYRLAIDKAKLDYQTLRNYAWVARKYDISRRRGNLSFQHHAELASLPVGEQDVWLDKAEQFGWSRNELRKQLRKCLAGKSAEVCDSVIMPRVHIVRERLEQWRDAAAQSGVDLESWIVDTLDHASASQLAISREMADSQS